MRWVWSLTATLVTGGLLITVAVYGWYGSLEPCQILKSDYLERKKIELERAGDPRKIGKTSVVFIYEKFIDGHVANIKPWQCLKDIAKLRTKHFENFREEALGESIGDQVPDFELLALPGVNGGGLSSEALRAGQVSVVNFFASWCVPCRAEAPLLQQLRDATDVQFLGINYMDKPADAVAWLSKHGNPYDRVAMDQSGETSDGWSLIGLPETYIFDGAGTIIYRHSGVIDQAILTQTILPMIEELSN